MPPDLPASYARGVRRPYADLPPAVHAWVADRLGGPVTEVEDRVGGFSPGCAAVVGHESRRVFVKAVSDRPNAVSLELYRRERERFAALPDHPALPKPLAGTDLGLDGESWTITLLPALPGRPPAHPWTAPVAELVFDRLADLQHALSASVAAQPSSLPDSSGLRGFFGRWGQLLDDSVDPWAAHPWVTRNANRLRAADARLQEEVVGDVPAHTDLRADNVILGPAGADGTERSVWFVDWAEARTAAAWVDPALLAADLVISGADRGQGGSMDVRGFLRRHPSTAETSPLLHRDLLVSLAATLHRLSRSPAQPGLPTIRGWQSLCADRLLDFVVDSGDLGADDGVW